jgi:5S rRNA maturation endonuclease (ribonuclease M5)
MLDIDIIEVLERLGVRVDHIKGDQVVGYCPDHFQYVEKYPSHPYWHINKKTGETFCHTEGRGSNLVYIVARLRDCKPDDAVKWILGRNVDTLYLKQLKLRMKMESSGGVEQEDVLIKLDDIQKDLENPKVLKSGYEYFMNPPGKEPTNIRKETVDKFKVFQRTYGYYINRVIVPCFFDEKLKGFCAIDIKGIDYWKKRNPDKDPKKEYKKVLYPKGFKTSKLLFGYDAVEDRPDVLVICEGAREVMKLTQEGINNSVALLGTNLSDDHYVMIFKKSPKKIVIMLDGDSAGRNAANKIAKELSTHKEIHIAELPEHLDPKNLERGELIKYINNSKLFDI